LDKEALIPVASPRASLMTIREEVDEAIRRVLDSGFYVLGPEVEAFETEFANFAGSSHAIGVNSGTDALALTLRGLGIGRGDEVITVSHTAVATVAAIEMAGATPVLVDVEPDYLTMDPQQAEVAVTPRTRAIVPVHLYGQVADLDLIGALCRRQGLALIEDASQAHGARWHGEHVGLQGHASVFSCYPTKNLGALGDAGVVVTGDPDLANRIRRLRQYGWEERNDSLESGANSRLDELQAAILRVKLRRLPHDVMRRRNWAKEYSVALEGLGVSLPRVRPNTEHAFHLYVVRHPQRDALRRLLHSRGIDSAIHYPLPVHQQKAYEDHLRHVGDLAITNNASQTVMSIPMFPELTQQEVLGVIEGLQKSLEEIALPTEKRDGELG
jgi:dTDP-4-amino-4,6-dideoxygalactose transaminase